MTQNLLHANQKTISNLNESLDHLEFCLLQYQVEESLAHDLIEVGYWANELLQTRISFTERQQLIQIIQRVSHLQMLFLQSVLDLRAQELTRELKGMISDDAWRVYLRLDEVYEMEKEFFRSKNFQYDYNLDLRNLEQEVFARYTNINIKTY